MKLIFVDETSDSKFKDYFGLCCAVIDSFYYSQLKRQFHSILVNGGWNTKVEFKGSYLFSAKKGDKNITIDKRINIACALLDLNCANKNARMHFHYFRTKTKNHKNAYITYLPSMIEKALPKAPSGAGKDIVAIQCDNRSDVRITEIREKLNPIVKKKKYVLFEDIVIPSSRFETVGILYADLIGYLTARIETISSDAELFENVPLEERKNNGMMKKLGSSQELIKKIKYIQKYRVKITKK